MSMPESNTTIATQSTINHTPTLRDSVHQAMQRYLAHLDGAPAGQIYEMVLAEVEQPLLETIMDYLGGNQSKAAIMLGISRGTLRKKLKIYDLEKK